MKKIKKALNNYGKELFMLLVLWIMEIILVIFIYFHPKDLWGLIASIIAVPLLLVAAFGTIPTIAYFIEDLKEEDYYM